MTGLHTRIRKVYRKKWFTTRIHRHRSRPGTGFGTAPALPISSCWPPVDKTSVFLSATFLQNQLPTTVLTFCSEAALQSNFPKVTKRRWHMKCLSPLERRVNLEVTGLFLREMLQNHRQQLARFWAFTLFVPMSAALSDSSRDFNPLATR